MARKPRQPWTAEQKAAASERQRERRARERETAAAAEAAGGEMPGQTEMFDRPPDPSPKSKPRSKPHARVKKPTEQELVDTLGKLLSMPAIPAKMVLHCDFCTAHFAVEGPKTAVELVDLSKDHPSLRGVIEDIHRAYTSITWVGIIAGYFARPAAHHLAPDGFLEFSEPLLGVPPRERHDSPAGGVDAAAVGDLSPDELIDMARKLGIDVDNLIVPDAPSSESTNGSETDPVPEPAVDAGALPRFDGT